MRREDTDAAILASDDHDRARYRSVGDQRRPGQEYGCPERWASERVQCLASTSAERVLRLVRDAAWRVPGARKCTNPAWLTMSLRGKYRPHRMSHPLSGAPRDKTTDQQPPGGRPTRGHRGAFGKADLRLGWSYRVAAAAVIVGFLIGVFAGYAATEIPVARLPDAPSMTQCVADTSGLFSQKTASSPEVFREARDHCYSLIQSHELFNDVAIRKLNFFQQYRANGILMWMVVTVTFSGVLLAGMQLWASYQLADANRTALHEGNCELILKHDQLVLKSSVTGLFILLISFCFFLVFVIYVYRFEIPADRNNSIALPAMPTLPMGGLGPPPGKGTP
jgi:hypothetical protein